jgi:hypothetical protein
VSGDHQYLPLLSFVKAAHRTWLKIATSFKQCFGNSLITIDCFFIPNSTGVSTPWLTSVALQLQPKLENSYFNIGDWKSRCVLQMDKAPMFVQQVDKRLQVVYQDQEFRAPSSVHLVSLTVQPTPYKGHSANPKATTELFNFVEPFDYGERLQTSLTKFRAILAKFPELTAVRDSHCILDAIAVLPTHYLKAIKDHVVQTCGHEALGWLSKELCRDRGETKFWNRTTPLIIAALCPHDEGPFTSILPLLELAGCSDCLNTKDSFGNSVLGAVLFQNTLDPSMCRDRALMLLSKGADPLVENTEGWSPLLRVLKDQNAVLLKAIFRHADTERRCRMLLFRDPKFNNPVFALASDGNNSDASMACLRELLGQYLSLSGRRVAGDFNSLLANAVLHYRCSPLLLDCIKEDPAAMSLLVQQLRGRLYDVIDAPKVAEEKKLDLISLVAAHDVSANIMFITALTF